MKKNHYFYPLFWIMNNKRFVDDIYNRHCVHVYVFSSVSRGPIQKSVTKEAGVIHERHPLRKFLILTLF